MIPKTKTSALSLPENWLSLNTTTLFTALSSFLLGPEAYHSVDGSLSRFMEMMGAFPVHTIPLLFVQEKKTNASVSKVLMSHALHLTLRY